MTQAKGRPVAAGLRMPNPKVDETLDPSWAAIAIAANAATAHAYQTGDMPEEHLGEAWIGAMAGLRGTKPEWHPYSRMRVGNELRVTARAMREILATQEEDECGEADASDDERIDDGDLPIDEIDALIAGLPTRQRQIVEDMLREPGACETLDSMGAQLGITRERIRQLLLLAGEHVAEMRAVRENAPAGLAGPWIRIAAESHDHHATLLRQLRRMGEMASCHVRKVAERNGKVMATMSCGASITARRHARSIVVTIQRDGVTTEDRAENGWLREIADILAMRLPLLAGLPPCPPEVFRLRQSPTDGTWSRQRQERDREERAGLTDAAIAEATGRGPMAAYKAARLITSRLPRANQARFVRLRDIQKAHVEKRRKRAAAAQVRHARRPASARG